MSFRSWCLAALITVFSVGVTCAAPSDYLFVEAEGEAAVINNDIAGAKAAAKRALYRNAVEKGIGASVHGITKMKDFEVLYDKVLIYHQIFSRIVPYLYLMKVQHQED